MILFKAWVNTEGSLTYFAAIFGLVPVTCCSVTADFAIGTTPIWYWLRKGPLFEPKRKLRILRAATGFCCFISIQQSLCNCPSEIQLS